MVSPISFRKLACVLLSAVLLMFGMGCDTSDQSQSNKIRLNTNTRRVMALPQFKGTQDDWINSKPLTVEELKGKVVLVDFWEYSCVNCIRTFPYLKEWNEKYKDKGLVIIGIHTPEFEFAEEKQNVLMAVKKYGLEFPILLDSKHENWKAYGNNSWPHKYLANTSGQIIYDHVGEGNYMQTESMIQQLLLGRDKNVILPEHVEVVREEDRPGAVCYPKTREMYAGDRGRRNGHFAQSGFKVGQEILLRLPSVVDDGVFGFGGSWILQKEYMETAGKDSAVAIQYRAKEANAVLKAAKGPIKVEILQDRQPLREAEFGADVKLEDGKAICVVNEPRMYSLVNNEEWGGHHLELRPMSESLQLYTFTFNTECK